MQTKINIYLTKLFRSILNQFIYLRHQNLNQNRTMKSHFTILCLFFFNITFSQDVQQVEVLKNDKQVEELFDELGDSELKLDVIDLLSQPALNIG